MPGSSRRTVRSADPRPSARASPRPAPAHPQQAGAPVPAALVVTVQLVEAVLRRTRHRERGRRHLGRSLHGDDPAQQDGAVRVGGQRQRLPALDDAAVIGDPAGRQISEPSS